MSKGKFFVLENPAASAAFREAPLVELAGCYGVESATFDMCTQELREPETALPMKKSTKLLSNSPAIISHFRTQQCICRGPHTRILGTTRVPSEIGTDGQQLFKTVNLSEFAGGYTSAFSAKLLELALSDIRRDSYARPPARPPAPKTEEPLRAPTPTVVRPPLPPPTLEPGDAEPIRVQHFSEACSQVPWSDKVLRAKEESSSRSAAEQNAQNWMDKLSGGDLSGPVFPVSQYLELRGEKIEGNPRQSDEYRDRVMEEVGLGSSFDEERYAHLKEAGDWEKNLDLIRWAVGRASGCSWLPGSHRATVRGFKHRLFTRGPPVRIAPHRLNRPDAEFVEKSIAEDVARGQLVKGDSLWGAPAFPTKEVPGHKAIKRSRRVVVDYRELNKRTLRRIFLIPNSDELKSNCAGNRFISVGDLKEGFNQVDNEVETAQKMAVVVASGCYLPRGLTFGPTNGPEDFQQMVFLIFARRLHTCWHLFLDDLAVVTGRKACLRPGPSGADDVVETFLPAQLHSSTDDASNVEAASVAEVLSGVCRVATRNHSGESEALIPPRFEDLILN